LAERAITSAAPSMIRTYSVEERAALGGGGPADWGRESWEASRDFVYPASFKCDPCAAPLPSETNLTQEDIERAIPVAQRRVAQAGIRMAMYLDTALAPGPWPTPARN
jgi:hypothetical protein